MKPTPIIFITFNSINKHLLHVSQIHIYEEFAIRSRIQAYKGDVNVYGPLWTLTCICAMWTSFLIILYVFPSLFLPKRHYHPLHHRQSHDRLSPSPQHHVWFHPPYILLFTPHSPVVCKDNFPLVYMYILSRYYSVFHYWFGSYVPSVNLSLKSWNRLHCSLQAFGLYCQWLPGLTTKSIHYYLHSYYFRTRFTSITLRIPPLMLSFDSMPLDLLVPKLMMRLSADAQIPTTQWLAHINYIIKCRIQALTPIKYILAVSTFKY